MSTSFWDARLARKTPVEIDLTRFENIHPPAYLQRLEKLDPGEGVAHIDPDTAINKYSLRAARLAAGAGLQAVESVMSGGYNKAFCAVRPPGHHAESAIGMGFCVFNSIALAAERALSLGARRVAILDFDVHHGNGTVEIFQNRPEVLVCSSFQYPFYPGRFDSVERHNICLTPLAAASSSSTFRRAIERDWLPALARHGADIILVSAGFDAHRDDPLAQLLLDDSDFAWLGNTIAELADRYCSGRVVSMLEGGYDIPALTRSLQEYLKSQA